MQSTIQSAAERFGKRCLPYLLMSAIAAVAMVLMFGIAPANASAGHGSAFAGPDGLERSITVAEGNSGLHFDLQPGDEIQVSDDGQVATLVTLDGTELIQFDSPRVEGAAHSTFKYRDGELTAVAAGADGGPSFTTFGCAAASAISWGWSILWAGMVCVPAALGTGGVGGFICGAVGSGISSFVPFDRVCG